MNEPQEPKIYIDFGIVNVSELSSDKVPDGFWDREEWYRRHKRRDDLELHIFNNNNAELNKRLSAHKYICELEDKGDYLSIKTNIFNYFGNYEDTLTERLIMLLQPESKDEDEDRDEAGNNICPLEEEKVHVYMPFCYHRDDDYLLEKINIRVYMRRCSGGETTDVPDRLLPVDPKQFSVYESIETAILESCKRYDFDGLRCEYRIVGNDRCSRCLFIEDSEDRWDGMRYQINFHISFYQMPGICSRPVEGREIQNIETGEPYVLDCIIAAEDRCDSFDDFSKWIDAYILEYRMD